MRLASRRSIRTTAAAAAGGVFTLTHDCDRDQLQEQDAEKIATYIRSEVDAGRRQFSDFLILTQEEAQPDCALRRCPGVAEHPDRGERRRRLRRLGRGRGADAAAARARRSAGCAVADRGPARPAVRGQRSGALRIQAGRRLVQHLPARRRQRDRLRRPNPFASHWLPCNQFYRWTRVLPAAAALDRILEHTGYLALAATTPGGVDAGDILHAVDRVRQVVEEGGSLADAADSLEADSEAANEVESLPLEPGRTDVVRLMNLHKAKGLEANVVFLADPNGGLPLRVDVHIERTDLKARGWFKLVQKSEANLVGRQAPRRARRLARTRSGGAAVPRGRRGSAALCGGHARARAARRQPLDGQPHAQGLGRSEQFPRQREGTAGAAVSRGASAVEPLDCSNEAQVASDAARIAAHDLVREPSWSITSVTAEARHIARMTRAADAAADDPTKVVGTRHARAPGRCRAWRGGRLIHGLLEHAMRQQDATADDLRRLGMWLTVEEPAAPRRAGSGRRHGASGIQGRLLDEAKKSEHSVETPFAFASAS